MAVFSTTKELRDFIIQVLKELGLISGGPTGPSLVDITIIGSSIPEGTSKAFQATGIYSDGTQADITPQVVWTSSEGTWSGNVLAIPANQITQDNRSLTVTATAGPKTVSSLFSIIDTTTTGVPDSTGLSYQHFANSMDWSFEQSDTNWYYIDQSGSKQAGYERTDDSGLSWKDVDGKPIGIGALGAAIGKVGIRRKARGTTAAGTAKYNGEAFAAKNTGIISGTIRSAASGNWNTAATWVGGVVPTAGTDKVVISAGHTVTLDRTSTAVERVYIQDGAKLAFSPTISVLLSLTRSLWNMGTLEMKPSTISQVHRISFTGVDETKFAGGGLHPIESDIGLWGTENCQFDLQGAARIRYGHLTASVAAGANVLSLSIATNWQVGDQLVICPVDEPTYGTDDYSDVEGRGTNPYFAKFERRTITAITGTSVTINSGLTNARTVVTKPNGGNWNVEVLNLTSNVIIEGGSATANRAHICINSKKVAVNNFSNVEIRFMGPRKLQADSNPRSTTRVQQVDGRYALNFEQCGHNLTGTNVQGCSIHDCGSKGLVPDRSHGIRFYQNVIFDMVEEAFAYPWQTSSHNLLVEANIAALGRTNGLTNRSVAFLLGMGDNNSIFSNAAVSFGMGSEQNGGAYCWDADSEGVWAFSGNLAHSCYCGMYVWQNSPNVHYIESYTHYNNYRGVRLGSYSNNFQLVTGQSKASPMSIKATSGATFGQVCKDLTIDAGGKPVCVEIEDSPIENNDRYANKFIGCTFQGYATAPLRLFTNQPSGSVDKKVKCVDLINCTLGASLPYIDNSGINKPAVGSMIRVQPTTGVAYQIIQEANLLSAKSDLEVFPHPSAWGTGKGFQAQYFNSSNYTSQAFTRTDAMIYFDTWANDPRNAPNGVHYLIPTGNFSMIWAGSIEPQVTGDHTFYIEGGTGGELWITIGTTKTRILSAPDLTTDTGMVASTAVALTAGVKYVIELRCFNANTGGRKFRLWWQAAALGYRRIVPGSQMYSGVTGGDGGGSGGGGGTTANLIYRETFEGSTFFSGWGQEPPTRPSYAIQKVSDRVRLGSFASRFELRDTVDEGRAEVRGTTSWSGTSYPSTRWLSWWCYWPSEGMIDRSDKESFHQMHQTSTTSPPIHFGIKDGRIYLELNGQIFDGQGASTGTRSYDLGAVPKDQWVRWTAYYKLSQGSDGEIRMYKNGVLAHPPILGANCYPWSSNMPTIKLGIYKWPWSGGAATGAVRIVYIDDIRIGNQDATLTDMIDDTI